MTYHLQVNSQLRAVDVPGDRPLLWVLRETLGLCGTKYGCGVGVCGICVVHLDGEPARACMTPVEQAAGKQILTIEGLAPDHPVVEAWIEEQVPQCGYCQPGQVMAAAALLARDPEPDDRAVDRALSGVLCRCGTYPRIRKAIRRAACVATAPRIVHSRAADVLHDYLAPPDALVPNPWIRIHSDGTLVVMIDRAEMGQGVITGLAMLAAEELGLPLEGVRAAFAPTDEVYTNPMLGKQLTGGSTSVRGSWEPLRRAAAQAREMLIAAAADQWTVPPQACRCIDGRVEHPASGRHLDFADLVPTARSLEPPQSPSLRPEKDFRLIGTSPPRLEVPAMVSGRAVYGIDVRLPGMHAASVARCPFVGGRLRAFNATEALAVPGVHEVFAITTGVAVVAEDTASALAGRATLALDWAPAPAVSTLSVRERLVDALERAGEPAWDEGDPIGEFERSGRVIEAIYQTPYLAHGCPEPMNCTAWVQDDGCDIWVGTQAQTAARKAAASVAGLPEEQVRVHEQFLGGGFGRRGDTDFVEEAVEIARRIEGPVQLLWTHSDDMRHDRFRPANAARLRAALDLDGMPRAWHQRVAGPKLGLDRVRIPYHIPHVQVDLVAEDAGVPTSAWRSVGASQNTFAVESFVDELAVTAGRDPLEYRDRLLAREPRMQAVLRLAAEKAGWGSTRAGAYQGIGFCHSFGSSVAQVVELESADNSPTCLCRVVCAIDCGIVVNPDLVRAQMEGAVIFALSAALFGEITLEEGRVQQSSFEDYPILTLEQTPEIEVHLVDSHEPPGGVGEPGVPPLAAALANALFAATGRRVRSLPLGDAICARIESDH